MGEKLGLGGRKGLKEFAKLKTGGNWRKVLLLVGALIHCGEYLVKSKCG